jgi:hypothetical protein
VLVGRGCGVRVGISVGNPVAKGTVSFGG